MAKQWMSLMTLMAVFAVCSLSGAYAADKESDLDSFNNLSPSEQRAKCKKDWERYRKSMDCFAPYVNVNGTVRAEAYERCEEVVNPGFYCGPEE